MNKVDWDNFEGEWKKDIGEVLVEKMRSSMLRKDLVELLAKKWDVDKKEARERVETIPFDWHRAVGTRNLRCENPLFTRRIDKTHMGKV